MNKGTKTMKKIILTILITLFSISEAKAEPMQVDLGQMFSDYKENEYAFKQKYTGKDLQFTALVSSIRAGCYTNFNGDETPCIELEHKKVKVSYFYIIPTNIGKALMYDNNDLVGLQKKQEINLICRLREDKALFESDPLVFENCKMVGKEYPVDLEIKAEVMDGGINERVVSSQKSCGSNCVYELDNKGFMLIKPFDPTREAAIQKDAFKERKDFTNVKVKEGVTSIGDYAFYGTYITKIDLPDSLTSIGKRAFEESKLKKVKIPDSVTSIEESAFVFNSWSGSESELKEVKLPQNIQVINDSTFEGNEKLKSITIPDHVISIEKEAFRSCYLENIKLSKSLKSIGNAAFYGTKISELNIPDSVVYIADEAFSAGYYDKIHLSYLVISDTTEVADSAFKNVIIDTVYCRGDLDTCKENLEDAIPESTKFVSLGDMNEEELGKTTENNDDANLADIDALEERQINTFDTTDDEETY